MLIACIFAYSILSAITFSLILENDLHPAVWNALREMSLLATQWVITRTYISAAFEATSVLDIKIYFDKKTYKRNAKEFNSGLASADIVVLVMIVIITALYIFSGPDQDMIYFVAKYLELVTVMAFLLAWAWTLVKLFKQIKNSEQLVPNLSVFKTHGVLLSLYVVFYLVQTILAQIALKM